MSNTSPIPRDRRIFNLILDTNILYGYPYNQPVQSKITELKSHTDAEITFYIPDLVEHELKSHATTELSSHMSKYNKEAKFLSKYDIAVGENIELRDDKIKSIIEKLFEEDLISVLVTDYSSIDLENISIKAAYYKPPFQKGNEKGFKDYVISECIHQHRNDFSNANTTFIVCGDENFRNYLNSIYVDDDKVEVVESLLNFESRLNLIIANVDRETSYELSQKADIYFRNEFTEKEIRRLIQEKFGHLITHPRIDDSSMPTLYVNSFVPEMYRPKQTGIFNVAKPVFISSSENIFNWNTSILFKQTVERVPIEYSQGPTSTWTYTFGESNYEHILEFVVHWQVELSQENEFKNGKIDNIKHVDTRLYPLPLSVTTTSTSTSTATSSMTSNATTLGQGTTPFSESPSVSPSTSPPPSPEPDEEDE